jgi:hypothetical protein
MRRIDLPVERSGQWAYVSCDRLWTACGTDVVTLVDNLTGARQTVLPGQRARPMGWWENPTRLIVKQYEDDCQILAIDPSNPDADPVVIAEHQWIQTQYGTAGSGAFGGAYAAGTLVWNGHVIDPYPGDWHCGIDGDEMVVLTEIDSQPGEALIYVRGALVLHKSIAGTVMARGLAIVREGMCGYGENGPPHILNCRTGDITNVSVSAANESTPVYSRRDTAPPGWIATGIQHGSRPNIVAIRPFGAKDVIALDVGHEVNGVDLRVEGNLATVAAYNLAGRCTIFADVDLTQERHRLTDQPPILVPPTTPTQPARVLEDLRAPNPIGPRYDKPTDPDPVVAPIGTMWMGLFFAQTFKYGPNDDWAKNTSDGVGLWLRAPGNCCVIAGEAAAGLTAPYDHVIITPDAILGGMADRPEYWARVAGFYLAAEASSNGVERMSIYRVIAEKSCAMLGVPCPPFFAYTPGRSPAVEMVDGGQTSIGLEFYANPGEGAGALLALADQYRQIVPRGTSVCIYGMAYDRNGAYRDDLRPIILAAANIARAWNADDPDSVKGLFYFSDGRGHFNPDFGGARWHPECYPVLRGIAAAITRPTF